MKKRPSASGYPKGKHADSPASKESSVPINDVIHTIRGERVILDADLARIYGVETRVLNQAVRRNRTKFPPDFLLEITTAEAKDLGRSRSQIVILKRGHNVKFAPFAFTEHGALMVATILKSPQAAQMSVFVIRAFIKMRSLLTDTRLLAKKLSSLETELKSRLDTHEIAIVEVLQRIMLLLDPPPGPEVPEKEIGFHATLATKPSKSEAKGIGLAQLVFLNRRCAKKPREVARLRGRTEWRTENGEPRMLSALLERGLVIGFGGVPIDHIPPGRDVIGPAILVVEIVRVFPDIETDDGFAFDARDGLAHERAILVRS